VKGEGRRKGKGEKFEKLAQVRKEEVARERSFTPPAPS
jgi:hypothetical protein